GGVKTFDACARENFKLKVAVLSTISDFLGYANLSGWSTKEEYAFPVSAYDKTSKWLDHGRKWCYMGHRRWLEHDHCWRRDIRTLPDHVSIVLIELCDLFRRICLKDLDENDLQFLESRVAVTLCKLEQIFPPLFFTVMVHLVIHLVREGLMYSQVICQQQSLSRRLIRNDDDDNKNKIESYNFLCPGRPLGQHFHSKLPSHKRKKSAAYEIDEKSLAQAHHYVLFNVDSIIQFRDVHDNHPNKSDASHHHTSVLSVKESTIQKSALKKSGGSRHHTSGDKSGVHDIPINISNVNHHHTSGNKSAICDTLNKSGVHDIPINIRKIYFTNLK
nr:transposon, En/Spm-like protein [Tanacetum cinerariifolium]